MRWILVTGVLALSACVMEEEDPCGAEQYRSLVGANIAAVSLPASLNDRVIGPDTAVTMDFVPTRLNIEIDEDGEIQRLYCG
ncbi:I78 family peptidase inhibitor [Jannaschia formosa]|uniref:I78 family peptidase inhibitor n=1 Tax=Jannaschia formosa TaxID=2259592 RepID=UPI001430BE79|nr:I78 family peptidase inhibitor [Jannaschia formosa]